MPRSRGYVSGTRTDGSPGTDKRRRLAGHPLSVRVLEAELVLRVFVLVDEHDEVARRLELAAPSLRTRWPPASKPADHDE